MKLITKILILCLVALSYCGEDYYRILGVSRNATKQQIKKAFKKLSLTYHPDKNKDNPEKAKNMFIKIANAYEVLSDDEQRKVYDMYGEEGLKEKQQRDNARQQGGANFGGGNFEDIFSQFFGGGGGRGNFRFQHQQQYHQQEEEREVEHFANTDVIQLKMNNISKLYARKEIWFVLFFKPQDREFKQLQEMFKELAEKTYGIFKIGAVNCKFDEEICEEFSVHSTPTIVYFPESSNQEEIYKGIKTTAEIFKFGASKMQSFVRIVNKDNYGDYATSLPTQEKVLLFTARKTTPPLLKALSKHFLGKLSFGEVRQSEKEVIQSFGIVKFPTIFVITDIENHKGVAYDGPLSRDSLQKFLNQYAYSTKKVEKKPEVKELTYDVYNKARTCNDTDGKNICVIYITHNDTLKGEENQLLEDLATKYLNDPLKFFYINPDKYKFFWVSLDKEDNDSKFIIVKGKRKKYSPIKGEDLSFTDVSNLVDNIVSGGGTFKNLIKKFNLSTVNKEDKEEL